MATKKQVTAAAHVVPARALTIACSGTEKIGQILAQFGCIREGKSVIALRIEVDSSVRMDMVPARTTDADLLAVASDADKQVLIAAKAVKAKLNEKTKAKARARVGNDKREVWSSKISIKRHINRG